MEGVNNNKQVDSLVPMVPVAKCMFTSVEVNTHKDWDVGQTSNLKLVELLINLLPTFLDQFPSKLRLCLFLSKCLCIVHASEQLGVFFAERQIVFVRLIPLNASKQISNEFDTQSLRTSSEQKFYKSIPIFFIEIIFRHPTSVPTHLMMVGTAPLSYRLDLAINFIVTFFLKIGDKKHTDQVTILIVSTGTTVNSIIQIC